MIKNNTLLDLFVVGKEVTFSDGDNEVTVWVQKINPTDHESLTRKANAARAKVLAQMKDKESDAYQEIYSDVYDMDKDDMADLCANAEILEKRVAQVVESEFSEKPEWDENNYLQGLRDLWIGGLNEKWMADQEDEEAVHVFDELKRFAQEIAEEVDRRRKELATAHLNRKIDNLMEDAIRVRCDEAANVEWLKTFRKGKLVYCVRDNKKRREHLLDWQSVDELQDETYNILSDAIRSLDVDMIEGKD